MMSFGKQDTPAPPDYTPVAQADAKAAQLQYDLATDQSKWSREQYAALQPYITDYMKSQAASADANVTRGQAYYDTYQSTYQPIEQQFAQTAQNYNSPERAEQRAGMAMADVTNQFAAQRKSALANLESYGIDPSQTRFAALDRGTRIAEAAATAAAGTQSRLNTEGTGLALQGEAINTGRGYAGNVSQAYATATNAGLSGAASGTNLYSAGSASMGTPTGYFAGGNQALGNEGNMMVNGYDAQLKGVQQQNQMTANGFGQIGSLIGGAIGFFA